MTNMKNCPGKGQLSLVNTNYNTGNRENKVGEVDYIQQYTLHGYTLIETDGKIPIQKHWTGILWDPLTTAEDFTGRNHGVALQEEDLVIDIDPRNFKEGINSLEKLRKTINHPLDDSLAVRTGGGGLHIYYKKDPDILVKGSLPEFPGVEFKTKGQQVIGAGNVFKDGSKYTLIKGFKYLRDAPGVLLDLIKSTVTEYNTGIEVCDDSESNIRRYIVFLENHAPIAIEDGTGENQTYRIACKGKDYGLTPLKTCELMLEHWNDRCEPPWDADDLLKKVNNAYQYGQNSIGSSTAKSDFNDFDWNGVDFGDEKERESWLNKYIPQLEGFKIGGKYENYCSISENIRFNKIVEYKNQYIHIWNSSGKGKDDHNYLNFTILSNYIIKPKRSLIAINDSNDDTHNLEIEVIDAKGDKGKSIILDPECKVNPKKASVAIAGKGNFTDILTEKQFKQILYEIYRDHNLYKKYVYQTPGLINNRNLWLYSDSIVKLETGEVIHADKEGVIKLGDGQTELALGYNQSDRPFLKYQDNINIKELTSSLTQTIIEGYSHSIEPFLVLGTSLMSPFADLFLKEINGFPIVWCYGLSGGGKSNLFDTISALYGFNKGFAQSGSSTVNKIWNTLSQYSKVPVMFEETNGVIAQNNRFENDLKCWYDRNKRGRMLNAYKDDNQNVNATVMFSSNNLPPQADAVLNRLIFCTFKPDSFIVDEVKKFNSIRDTQLSNLLPEILKYKKETILKLFKEATSLLNDLDHTLDTRSFNNLAVALTGSLLLFKLAEKNFINESTLIEKLENYMGNHNELYQTDNAFDVFLSYLTILNDDYKLKSDHYEITTDKKYLKLNHNKVYPVFEKEYRQRTGLRAPMLKEILFCAGQDRRVDKGKNTVTKNVKVNKKQTQCVVIDISENETLKYLLESEFDN